MPAKKESEKKVAPKVASKANEAKVEKPDSGKLSAPVYSLVGVKGVDFELPKEVFGAKINEQLLAQALRVYSNNLKGHFSHTKTRGEVEGSTRKLFKQKGTGRARHGAVRAPIFVGGGIALGPKSRVTNLDLPKRMKKAALISALSFKAKDDQVELVSGLDKASGKTKEIVNLMGKLNKKSVLFVTDEKKENVVRAVKNIKGAEITNAEQLNVYEVFKYQNLLLTKEAVERLQKRLLGKEEK